MQADTHTSAKYRADIDGLRGIAVLLVVLNHLRFWRFRGGYVGVDVFFAISGYLIGSSMLLEFGAGTFSLAAFYERRVRRILPALLAMLAFTSVLAYRFLMPKAFSNYAKSLLAALFSVSNFYFWTQDGYFVRRLTKPLVHTWSLGVEEQFYLLLPLLLYVLFRYFPHRVREVLSLLVLVDFGLACWFTAINSPVAFYWSPLRAWELLAGVLVSQYRIVPLERRWVRESSTLGGLLLIVSAGLFYTAKTQFPGWSALVPCVGALLILAAGQAGLTGVGRLLALRPLRFVGLISYSLYLWHWPLLVFQDTSLFLSDKPLRMFMVKLRVLPVLFAVAVASWWLVERPFRQGRWRPSRSVLYCITGVATAALAVFGLRAVQGNGLEQRFSPEVRRLAFWDTIDSGPLWRPSVCFLGSKDTFRNFNPDVCLSQQTGKKSYLVYGDSTAAVLYSGLSTAFPEIDVQQATVSQCKPYEDHTRIEEDIHGNCPALWRYLHEVYFEQQHPAAVFLAAVYYPDLKMLGDEITFIQRRGIPVIVVGPSIAFDTPLPQLLATEMQRHRSPAAATEHISEHLQVDSADLDRQMSELARNTWHVQYVSYFQELCGRGIPSALQTKDGCPLLLPEGAPLVADTIHLSMAGSTLLARQMKADGFLP